MSVDYGNNRHINPNTSDLRGYLTLMYMYSNMISMRKPQYIYILHHCTAQGTFATGTNAFMVILIRFTSYNAGLHMHVPYYVNVKKVPCMLVCYVH